MTDTETAAETEENKGVADVLFPHDTMRDVQEQLVHEVVRAVAAKKDMIVHAPTGLGKTAAVLAPAFSYAVKNKKKVFFLTSRHTQHTIAIDTLKELKKRHGVNVCAVDAIGKRYMCPEEGTEKLSSGQFAEYCRKQREKESCEFFNATKKGAKFTPEAKLALEELKQASPVHIEEFGSTCKAAGLCTYELALTLAKDADVIVADYYYLFSSSVRNTIFKKAGIEMGECIVIVDEAHNLPDRIRTLMTKQLSSFIVKNALKEAKKLERPDMVAAIAQVQDVLNEISNGLRLGEEIIVGKQRFIDAVEEIDEVESYGAFWEELEVMAGLVRESEKQSWIGTLADFIQKWEGPDEGFARIISVQERNRESNIVLTYRCLDPSLVSSEVVQGCHSVVLMSGTLQPTSMYRDLLGFREDNTVERTYPSPFPNKNRLNLVIPATTTKFSARGPEQYARIAAICAAVTDEVPGNCAVFFPSYHILNEVRRTFEPESTKTVFAEYSGMTKEEKADFLERFKSYRGKGAVLLGAITGSYGEGIDLPGDFLNCVVVVGLPLQKPDLEVNSLIKYYDGKFGRGWDYGYVFPAFQRTLQSAGRCIRSESDRGVIVFLDERYAWQRYYQNFPKDWDIVVSRDFQGEIREFFAQKG